MTEHNIATRIYDAHGCETVSNNALYLWDNPNALYSSWHASADLERELCGFFLLAKVRRILTNADITQIRRDSRCARQLLFRWKLWEAYEHIDRIERALGDAPSSFARRVRADMAVLRAMGAALQDDSLSALQIALKALRCSGISPGARRAASAVCRFAHWRLRDFDGFNSVPRHRPTVILSKRHAMAAVINLCVEAAFELEQLRLSGAKRLAMDALEAAQTACKPNDGLPALPASIVAQVLYEQGSLD
ncbi:MAG: LuxR family transcriptional regulator, maltose regulon positive regulatory protein, partial [Gammaproteobacteria bacterium]|nr:LuxR family transcriptional regulator, maltose regulon positive regulatory protein [Gammaproteobacteria bacterium]